ncbi:MAG: penicillin-binding protein 1B [Halothiobacillaceae bacterium]
MAKRKQTRRRQAGRGRSVPRRVLGFALKLGVALVLIGGVFLALWVAYLDRQVQERFAGALWAVPAKVYGRPLELYAGAPVDRAAVVRTLQALGYRESARAADRPGRWTNLGPELQIHVREFEYWDGAEPSGVYRVTFAGDTVRRVRGRAGEPVGIVRLDAPLVGNFYADQAEDRLLLRLDETPAALVDTLLAVEDRQFYEHSGLNPLAILRAAFTNLVTGRTVQGGSTITQQLAKNLFLSAERTYRRKAAEAIIAIILEARYGKEEILEAYLNEIYLGQDGARAIHGFGLAAEFYFGRPVAELDIDQIALLVGMVKGASFYNPRRNPERALERRNVVLSVMQAEGLIPPEWLERLQARPLGVLPRPGAAVGNPAFMQLVRRQLAADYSDVDLRTRGLRIFTTFDPQVQYHLEQAVENALMRIEGARGLEPGSLESAAVIVDGPSAEILALVGGRDTEYAGFNRALDARRQIGSLIKPAIYLTALSRPQRYTLVTPLEDAPLRIEQRGSETWSPRNYDNRYLGAVPLFEALAQSRNVPAVQLGMALGLEQVGSTLERMGLGRGGIRYPADLLGSQEHTVMEVAGMYHTLATEGFRMPLRAIRSVVDSEGRPLNRYGLSVERVLDPAATYLTNHALKIAVSEGTGRAAYRTLDPSLEIAGKTGTTNGSRDSWFAGFTGDKLGVVWVGRDDNGPTGLTGASGALPVWVETFSGLDLQPGSMPAPAGIGWARIDPEHGVTVPDDCPGRLLPFAAGRYPPRVGSCP